MAKKRVRHSFLIHSRAKVHLLGEYLIKYLLIIGNDRFTSKITIVDMFCGVGQYRNGGQGSPIVILENVNKFVSLGTKNGWTIPTIDCYFNDLDPLNIENVKQIVDSKYNSYKAIGNINLSSEDYSKISHQILELVNRSKDTKFFIFIDPFGYKPVEFSLIQNLVQTGKVEVLLWLPIPQMFRFVNSAGATTLTTFLRAIGFPDERFDGDIDAFILMLQRCMQNTIGGGYFVDFYSLKKSKTSVYCLFFFTGHIKGYEKMLETKWSIDKQEGKGWDYHNGQFSMFGSYQIDEFEQKLNDFIKESPKTNGEIYHFTIMNRHIPKHTNQILTFWQKSGLLTVYDSEGNPTPPGAFYITYFKPADPDNHKAIIKFK